MPDHNGVQFEALLRLPKPNRCTSTDSCHAVRYWTASDTRSSSPWPGLASGVHRASLRRERAVEEEFLQPRVVMEVLDVAEVDGGGCHPGVQIGRAMRRDLEVMGPPPRPLP